MQNPVNLQENSNVNSPLEIYRSSNPGSEFCPLLGQLDFTNLSLEYQRLLTNLVNFAKTRYDTLIFDKAWQQFSSWVEETYPQNNKETKLFYPWLVFCWRPTSTPGGAVSWPPSHHSIAEDYFSQNVKELNLVAQKIIIQAIQQRPSFYEVIDCVPGESITAIDLFNNEEYRVLDRWKSQSVRQSEILFALLCPIINKDWLLLGSSVSLSSKSKHLITNSDNLHIMPKPVHPNTLEHFSSEIFEIYHDILVNQQQRRDFWATYLDLI